MLKKYIADCKFYKELFIVIIPIVLQFFIQNFINFLDNIMVGQLGPEEIAAVAVANQYYKLFYPAIVSICTGAAIFTAQYYGSRRAEEIQKTFGIKLTFPLIITILFVGFGFLFPEKIINLFLSNNKVAATYGVNYLKIAIWSYIPLSISTAFTFTFRSLKMTVIPMVASSIGMITNLILNFFLIYGIWIFPELGVQGAALGTVIARVLELTVYLVIFTKRDFIFKTWIYKYFIIDIKLAIRTMKKVIPLFINEILYTVALIIIFKVYSELGVAAISVVNISEVVSQVIFILASGLGTSTSILVGYKLGNNEIEEAEKNANYLLGYGFFMGLIIMILVSLCAFIVPGFYNISQSTKEMTTYAILIQGMVAPIMMLTRIPFFVLRSGGRVYEILFLDALFMWVVKVPVALIFGYLLGANIIVLFFVVESTRFLNAIISMAFFKQKKWLRNLTVA